MSRKPTYEELEQKIERLEKEAAEFGRVEKSLRHIGINWASLLDNINDGVYILNRKGYFVYVNRVIELRSGIPLDKFVRLHFLDIVNEKDHEHVNTNFERVMRGEDVPPYELEYTRANGTSLVVETNTKAIYQGDEIVGLQGVSRNVTERRQAEEAIRQSEEKYRSVVERSTDGVAIIQDGLIKYANPALTKMTGYDSEVLNTPFISYIHPQEMDRVMRFYQRRMAGAEAPARYESALTHKDGTRIEAEMDGGIILYEGKPANLVIIRDITDRKRAENELRQSRELLRGLSGHLEACRERERSVVAREIHDDLGQTLTALKIQLRWLEKRLPQDEELLIEKARSMVELVDTTVQSVKRIYSGLRPFLLDDLGLAAAIEWMAQRFQEQTGVECEVRIGSKETDVDKNLATALFRIFQETLTNVGRHAHATRVTVTLKEKAGRLNLTVSDNGKGMTEGQVIDSKSFGLIGIRERVRALGGEANITGAPDKGTTVTVSIPLEEWS